MANALTLGTSAIRELDGLYSLNDLHRASGGEAKHEPNYFVRLDSTQSLIAEIAKSPQVGNCIETKRGANGGTYACRELVIAYAAWISAAFHLKVIRVFLAQQTQPAQFFSGKRWLVCFRDGREVIQEIDWNDCLLKYDDLPKLIKSPDNMLPSELLSAIGQACIERLNTKNQGITETIARLRTVQNRNKSSSTTKEKSHV